jgi:hypothetical protein
MAKVPTVYNGFQPKSKARYYKSHGAYFLVGDPKVKDSGGCYPIKRSGTVQYFTKDFIRWDETNKSYYHKDDVKKVIVFYNPKTYKTVYGYVSKNTRTIKVFDSNSMQSIDALRGTEVATDFYTGRSFVGKPTLKMRDSFGVRSNPKSYPEFGDIDQRIYSYADFASSTIDKVKKESSKIKEPVPYEKGLKESIGELSLGVEIETSFSNIESEDLFQYGFLPVYDGSLRPTGNEYVSIPIFDINGIRNLYHFSCVANKNAKVNSDCSLHVHIGNIKGIDEKKFVVCLYTLYSLVQEEISEILPAYKRDFRFLAQANGGRGKDYCAPLKRMDLGCADINKRFLNIWTIYNDHNRPTKKNNPENRIHVRRGSRKWDIQSRYSQLNFFPFLFGNSGTVEFRAHSGTVDPEKIMNWTYICLAIVNYAIKHADKILKEKHKYELEDIVDDIYRPELAQSIKNWLSSRKQFFQQLFLDRDNGQITEFENEGYVYPEESSSKKNSAYDIVEGFG